MPELNYDIEKLADIAAAEQLAFVVLFGSLATGKAGPKSDADIGVYFKHYPEHPYEVFRNLTTAFKHDHLDLVDLNQENPLLHFRIAQEGQVLWQDGPFAFRRFQNEASKQYADTAKFRRWQQEFIKGRKHGN